MRERVGVRELGEGWREKRRESGIKREIDLGEG
jgi:hypothetical protein